MGNRHIDPDPPGHLSCGYWHAPGNRALPIVFRLETRHPQDAAGSQVNFAMIGTPVPRSFGNGHSLQFSAVR
jgi:hypothetical protein